MKKEQFVARDFFIITTHKCWVFKSKNGRANGIIFLSNAVEQFHDKFIFANGRTSNGKFIFDGLYLNEILIDGLGSLHKVTERITKIVDASLTFVCKFLC